MNDAEARQLGRLAYETYGTEFYLRTGTVPRNWTLLSESEQVPWMKCARRLFEEGQQTTPWGRV